MSDIRPVSQFAYHNQVVDGSTVPYGSIPIGEDYFITEVVADHSHGIEAFFPGAVARPGDLFVDVSVESEED